MTKKKYLGLFSFLAIALLFGAVNSVSAAADPVLTSAIASSTGFFTDNAMIIVNFIVSIVLQLAGIALAFGAVYWIYRKLKSIFTR